MAARRPPASLNAVETGVDITRQPSFVRAWQRRHRSQQRGRAQKWCNKFDLASSLLVSMPIVYEETPDGHVSLIDCGHPMEWQHGTAARVLHEHVHVAVASFHNPAVQRTFCSRPRMVSSSVNKTIEFLQQVAFGSDSDRGACNYMEDRHYAEVVTNADMFLGRDAEWTPPSSDKLQKDRPPVQRAARLSNSGDGHAHAADLMTPRTLDYLSLVFPHAFFAVFDGHAGETAAEYVKATLHRHILQTLYMTHDVVTAIRQGHILTDLRLLAEAKRLSEEERNDDKAQSGSTAVSVLLHGRSMFIANVGDSRAVLGRLRPPARACSEPNVSGPSAGGTGGTETARPTMRSFSDGPLLPASASAKAPSSLDALLTKMGGSAASTPVSRTPLPTNSNRSKFEAVSLSWDQNVWRQDEVRRVVDECGGVIKGEGSHARVGGYVQVTRAFGDYDVYSSEKIKGLSSEPEVHHCVVQPDVRDTVCTAQFFAIHSLTVPPPPHSLMHSWCWLRMAFGTFCRIKKLLIRLGSTIRRVLMRKVRTKERRRLQGIWWSSLRSQRKQRTMSALSL